MKEIAFLDTEIDPSSKRILDIGSVKGNGEAFHNSSATALTQFISGSEFVGGHNILHHDLKYIGSAVQAAGVNPTAIIDTLFLSPLLFPAKPYHALLKDDKLQTAERNNPLNDAIKAKDLFFDEVAAFNKCNESLKQIFYLLLKDKREFRGFFHFVGYSCAATNPEEVIRNLFRNDICERANLAKIIRDWPAELAYCLALLNCHNRYSITPPWILKQFPAVERVMYLLRNKPCLPGCGYCDGALDARKGLKRFFGFDAYRTYAGEPLQEAAVDAAISGKSILAVFPTGGGKSITFQVPALMAGESCKGLTVVISPLQSLMKDQVDNLEGAGITDAVTINGLLDPIERAKSFERVLDGSASILYISPESLRSRTIEAALLGRKIVRFVIDEAHCFSSWGQDFRVDYLYIGDFIRELQAKKNGEEPIPVSCFTATAKQKVIEDIRAYFRDKLSLELQLFTSKAARSNLQFKVSEMKNDEEKYGELRDLIDEKNCPTIIYVSRTARADKLSLRLNEDGFVARAFHGKMDKAIKTTNQDAFLSGEVPIMVATSAFGMGVDKKDVGMVIHYEISDSLENYVQEAGRAGRDERITADCFILFNEEDLGKHFILLNQTKLSIKEIQQVWKAIKEITRFRSTASNSALEIARKAGWDDSIMEIETRVKTAIAALEDAGYLKRGQNMPRVFANSILSRNAQEAIDKINASEKFEEAQKEHGIRIIKKLFSSKRKSGSTDDEAESRIDYISDQLGIVKAEVIHTINLLREEKILADAKDLTAFIRRGETKNRTLQILESFRTLESFLLPILEDTEQVFHIKALNEEAERSGCSDVTPARIKTLLNFWAIKGWIKRQHTGQSNGPVAMLRCLPADVLQEKLRKRHETARFIAAFLHEKSANSEAQQRAGTEEVLVEFSVHELKEAFEQSPKLFEMKVSLEDVEDTLFYLSRIEAIKMEGGFLVVYNRLTIERLEQDNKRRYKVEDYQKLAQFYEAKVQQIHIVGEYARKMIDDYTGALRFVEDYFQLNYTAFLQRYFPGSKADDLKLRMTPGKFKQLFGELSPTQLKIVKEEAKHSVVAAGPGSGKTKVVVHKLASLLLMEDVKHEQLLMVTFSRAAATEFKKRLLTLIGNAAHYIEIKTFHSYCFDLLGKVGSLEKSDAILKKAIERIRSGEVELSRITKTVLVIDEAQDMDRDEFELINVLTAQNEDMRVIAVGDDDQNIYEFRGSSSQYLLQFIQKGAIKHELSLNYRSKTNLVQFTNGFVTRIQNRLKGLPIVAAQTDSGRIRVIRYHSRHLATPVVNDITSYALTGTTCVLTKTNAEASQITGMLLRLNRAARLIQSNDGFYLQNLREVHFFLMQLRLADDVFIIPEELWEEAKRAVQIAFRASTTLEVCNNIIRAFEATNIKRKYRSDLDVFLRESCMEDFFPEGGETIFVSTIHKAKGREFDNVFLMLDNFIPQTDEDNRLLYVAMTRAKQNLSIHLAGNYLDNIKAEGVERMEDSSSYSPPPQIAVHLGLKDVWLDYFIERQHLITPFVSGDVLNVNEEGCTNSSGQSLARFSKRCVQEIEAMRSKNYRLKSARVNLMLYWRKDGAEEDVLIVLPELLFQREG